MSPESPLHRSRAEAVVPSTDKADLWEISGTVEVRETRRPVEGLLVSAFDKDLAFDDHLGVAVTDPEGRFVIRFTEDRFQDIVESEPDIYLRVFDASGKREVYATRDKVRYNASRKEKFKLRVPARNLGL